MHCHSFILALFLVTVAPSSGFAEEGRVALQEDLLAKANAGDAQSQYLLGSALLTGRGVLRDQSEGLRWLRSAAAQGGHQYQVAFAAALQETGNATLAREWYARAVKQGNLVAAVNLAYLHLKGLGGPKDPRQALWLLEPAARHGEKVAMLSLSDLYLSNELGYVDAQSGCSWAASAAKYLTPSDVVLLRRSEELTRSAQARLSPAQFAHCKDFASTWQPTSPPDSK
jgi:TPR repeat protein